VRKYYLSALVAAVFVGYSIALRHQDTHAVILPSSLSNNSANNSSSNSSSAGSNSGSSATTNTPVTSSKYKDGNYTGSVENAFYGNVQVAVSVQGGKLTSVKVLQFPNDNPNSQYINSIAVPALKQEAIQSQSSNVSMITGATLTSQAFIQSLSNALNQAN
jgi:uncharacterized protein with FMN-binding domain